MPTTSDQYGEAAAAAAAAAVDINGGDDSLDELVMMAPSAVAAATAEETTVAAAGKRKHDDIMTDAEAANVHHHPHDDVVAPMATTNDPMLLETADDVAPHEETFPSLPPPVPHEAPAQPATETIMLPVVHHHHHPHLLIRPSPEGLPDKPKSKRINWGKSPHKERLTKILSDWFSKSGMAIDESTGQPMTDYRLYAAKVGISRTTLFKYIHKDPSKRRLVREDGGSGTRGKKRLMSEEEVRSVVRELKEGKE